MSVTIAYPNGYNTGHWLYAFVVAVADVLTVDPLLIINLIYHEFAGGGWNTGWVLRFAEKHPEYRDLLLAAEEDLEATLAECVANTAAALFTTAPATIG